MAAPVVEASPAVRVRSNLEELGMDRMAELAGEHMSLVAAGSKTYAESLLELTGAQVAAVRERDLWRRVQKANFPYVKTLADFDFSFQPSLSRPVVEDLATMGFLERGENVVLVGSPGVGKTHIAVSLGVEAVRCRKLTYFADCQRLVDDLKRAAAKGQLERRMRFYAHLSLLILDELGYLGIDKEGADLLFQLVSRRYERRSTIVTTNVGIGAWAQVFGDPVTASAIADRVCHHCHVIRITGRSYRMKDILPDLPAR
ncbi:MAG: IS21-like element helper ATPase IstB, partial [Atopobiaceae bacterium]|nr:IS21-like element helper ATPase IstB [Atopobiaceae bacterium]